MVSGPLGSALISELSISTPILPSTLRSGSGTLTSTSPFPFPPIPNDGSPNPTPFSSFFSLPPFSLSESSLLFPKPNPNPPPIFPISLSFWLDTSAEIPNENPEGNISFSTSCVGAIISSERSGVHSTFASTDGAIISPLRINKKLAVIGGTITLLITLSPYQQNFLMYRHQKSENVASSTTYVSRLDLQL